MRLTTEIFIKRATKQHGELYSYSESMYTTSRNKVAILCQVHGKFYQDPAAHCRGQGCPACAGRDNYQESTFLALVRTKHTNKYTYNLPDNLSSTSTIEVICPRHGAFNQRASSHMEGVGCEVCAFESHSSTYLEFVGKANKVHRTKYTYNNLVFTLLGSRVTVTCKEHGDFITNKSNHLQGHGCPKCYVPGYDKRKPGTLYYLKVTTPEQVLYKIGITNRTVDERFTAKDLKSIEILYSYTFLDGSNAYSLEQDVLREFKHVKYTGDNVLLNGNTELFTEDIFTVHSPKSE